MEDFLLYFRLGFEHVLDFRAYDHLLFLWALSLAFDFKSLRPLIWTVTLFSIGHTLTLLLGSYDFVHFDTQKVELWIALTIALTAFVRLLVPQKGRVNHQFLGYFCALGFGLIHGLGFSSYLKMLLAGADSKFLTIFYFAIGIEAVQILWVLGLLLFAWLMNAIFRIAKRDWVLVISAIIIGITIPMILGRV